MSRQAVARELQNLLEQLHTVSVQAEAVASSSGLIDPKWFRGARAAYAMAAGELDQKGLLDRPTTGKALPA